MSAKCPPNSTDCLLRALVDANSGYNWNPLNFAFTAALSVLGFVVATVTLIQGLLAAGPGRVKASRSAVGYIYSQKARTRFDRTELRFRTLVRVPVLDIERLLVADGTSPSYRRSTDRIGRSRNAARSPEAQSRSLAGWSRLLEDLDLEDFEFTTLPCATDYLPGDIQAAPAYASVESVVIMALLAGCEDLQPVDGFLRATGLNLQLEFRSHQNLGVVAVYQHYFSTEERRVDNSSHPGTIHEALGHLRYGGGPLFELSVRSPKQASSATITTNYNILAEAIDRQRSECNHPGCASRKDTVASWTTFLQEEKPNQSNIDKLTTLLFADKPTAARMFPTALADFRSLLNDIGNRKYKDTWFHQSTVAQDLELLPDSDALIDIKNLEQFEPLRTREARNRDDRTWFVNKKYLSMKSEGRTLQNFFPVGSSDKISCLRSMAFEAFHSDSADTKVLEEDSILISDQALTACFSWLANGEKFVTMGYESRASTREHLFIQLREVDWWLGRHGGSDALCAALSLIKNLQATAPLEDEAENFPPPVPPPDAAPDRDDEKPRLPKRRKSSETRMLDQKSKRPTWIRCNRQYLAPETLNYYKLPWEFDWQDPAYIVIKQWIPEDFQEVLFERTRLMQDYKFGMTNVGDARGDHPYRIHRRGMGQRGMGRKKVSNRMSGEAAADAMPTRRQRPSRTARNNRADDDNTTVPDGSRGPRGDDVRTDKNSRDNHAEGGTLDHQDEAVDPQTVDGVVTSARLMPSSAPSRHSSVDTNKTSNSDDSNGSSEEKDSRLKAMETMLLYRAMLFACLLATGTDTGELLWLENRNRIVQVL